MFSQVDWRGQTSLSHSSISKVDRSHQYVKRRFSMHDHSKIKISYIFFNKTLVKLLKTINILYLGTKNNIFRANTKKYTKTCTKTCTYYTQTSSNYLDRSCHFSRILFGRSIYKILACSYIVNKFRNRCSSDIHQYLRINNKKVAVVPF